MVNASFCTGQVCLHAAQTSRMQLRGCFLSGRSMHRSMAQHKSQNRPQRSCLKIAAMMAEGDLDPDVQEGKRVRVKEEVLVFHAPKHKEGLQLKGKEGTVKQIVKNFKGKELSANLPYRIEFILEVPDAKDVKFFAHMDAAEFELVD